MFSISNLLCILSLLDHVLLFLFLSSFIAFDLNAPIVSSLVEWKYYTLQPYTCYIITISWEWPRILSHGGYTVAWICALPLETAAAKVMLVVEVLSIQKQGLGSGWLSSDILKSGMMEDSRGLELCCCRWWREANRHWELPPLPFTQPEKKQKERHVMTKA